MNDIAKFTIKNIYYICKKNKPYEFYLNNLS